MESYYQILAMFDEQSQNQHLIDRQTTKKSFHQVPRKS